MFVVFDLDGTIANHDHRHHLVTGENKNWDLFFSRCVADTPNNHVIGALNSHLNSGHRVEIWSGRSAVVETETRAWLNHHGIEPLLLTHMRPVNDHTEDDLLKLSWLLACGEQPDIVYDDRDILVNMFRENNIPCFQVAPGSY